MLHKMKKKGFYHINNIISKTAQERKLVGALNRYWAIKYWETAVSGFIKQATDCTKAVDLKNGILVVACLSKETAYQIKLLAQRIISTLNQLIGKQIIFGIKVEY